MALSVLAIHGIATAPSDRTPLMAAWRQTLAAAGIQASVRLAAWDSRGNGLADLTRIVGSADFRHQQVATVSDQIAAWLRAPIVAGSKRVIIAHSMGQALGADAVRHQDCVPFVSIGGPLGNAVFGRVLQGVGLGLQAPAKAWDVWDSQDRVSNLNYTGPTHRNLPGWTDVRVAKMDSRPGLFTEHPAVFYLAHPFVIRILREIESG